MGRYVYFYIALFVSWLIWEEVSVTVTPAGPNSKMRACISVIQSIESGLEMYNSQYSVKLRELDHEILKNYFSGKKFPLCPSGGEYQFYDDSCELVCCTVHRTKENPIIYSRKEFNLSGILHVVILVVFPYVAVMLISDIRKMHEECKRDCTAFSYLWFFFWCCAVYTVIILGGILWIVNIPNFKGIMIWR